MNRHITDKESLIAEVERGFRPKYVFFRSHSPRGKGIGKECLSQWWPSPFTVEGVEYQTAEHFMMAEKARLFGDSSTREKILSAPHPHAAKALGREVRGFDEATWSLHRFDIAVRGNEAKFDQNEAIRYFLLNTGERVLVEASPVDRIWGIGLADGDPMAEDPRKWRGLNLLGFALMEIRSRLSLEGVTRCPG